ncbi:MAG: KaiC domain-containing protein [Candidatus Bathyarchaeota archaeon]|nr:KaiC domain-containing protein [Candidatus Bathyarchaeota archaeon]
MRRLSTGVPELDKLIAGGIPEGFFVALTGEPGTGKTILCMHFVSQGLREGEGCIYVTTEEDRSSIINQAEQFNLGFGDGLKKGRLIIIDALTGSGDWSIDTLDIEKLVSKIIEAKKALGYGHARLVIDSLSAFWLDKPSMARRYSYSIKRILSKWNLTILATSQYAITTADAFGFGVEHIADGIIRFRRVVRGGILRRYIIVEKMRQTPHSLYMYEVTIVDGKGLTLLRPTAARVEDIAIPENVKDMVRRSHERTGYEVA